MKTAKGSLEVASDTTSEDGTFQVAYSGGKPIGLPMSMMTTTYLVTSFDDPVTIAAPDQSDVTSG